MSDKAKLAKQANMLGTIDDLHRQLDATSTKSASTLSEPGSIGGETTHPVKSVDDRLQKATEGSRSSENSEDVKEDQPNVGVDSTSEGTPGGQDSVQLDVGITSKSTGEDPSAETDKAKGGKEDPGSSHPARTDNDELDGSKYSSQYDFFDALCKQAQAAGNDLLATITVESDNAKKAAAKDPVNNKGIPAPTKQANTQPEQPVEDAAPELDKQAVDSIVLKSLVDTVAHAEDRAVKTAEYLSSYFATRKKAEDEAVEEAPVEAGPPEDAGAPAGGGEMGPPMAGPEAGGGEGGGDELAMLQQILQETGMTPEDLIQLIAESAGGAEGGAGGPPAPGGDPMAGGAPPMPQGGGAALPPPPPGGDPMAGKMAAAKRAAWRPKTAADRAKYAKVKSHLVELMAANKR